MAEIKLSIEEYHNLFKGLNTLIKKLYEMAKEGNDYKRQRDELINDMAKLRERNAELERKLDKEVKLSYEIEKNLYDTSKERDELINDMAEVKRKAEAWIDLKKEMVEMYPVLVNDVEITSGECEKGMLYQLGKHLRRMDELDGTHEFRNLLDDLERGSDE